MSFLIRLLQVRCGDAILVKYENAGNKHNLLIDGGYLDSYTEALQPEIKKIIREKGTVDPWVLTHLDADHINGFVSFTRDRKFAPKLRSGELWFNCFNDFRIRQLNGMVSVGKGVEIRDALAQTQFTLKAQIVSGHQALKGGAHIQVLTPDQATFEELRAHWEVEEAKYWKKRGLVAVGGKKGNDYQKTIAQLATRADAREPRSADITNRSSISFILTIGEKKMLFLGDAYPSAVIAALSAMRKKEEKLHFDYVKLAHHGSRKNFSGALLDIIDCRHFFICSNGANQHFIPDKETLAKIICHPGRDSSQPLSFYFNYDNATLRGMFDVDQALRKKYNFNCLFPKKRQRYYELKIGP